MSNKVIEQIEKYEEYLNSEEKSKGTINKYIYDARTFLQWLGDREIDKNNAVQWKECMVKSGYAAVTINSKISSLNSFLRFLGMGECQLKFLKIQRKMFRPESKELSKAEYFKLVQAAGKDKRAALLLETMCSTGVRVSEVRYITVEAARRGMAEVAMKGKIRTIILPAKLCEKLLQYVETNLIECGEIFLSKDGRSMTRKQIWTAMKSLSRKAGVDEEKVYPHNLRHLFARTYYAQYNDVVGLANILGHSSVETTRIYLKTSSLENARQLDTLGLVS